MKLLCKLFGHRPAFGYCRKEGQGYFEQQFMAEDGLGRVHARLYCHCERCDQRYQVGMTHVRSVEELTGRGPRPPVLPSTDKPWVVHFHEDGGQCCIPGQRSFADVAEAMTFAGVHRGIKGHTCSDPVRVEYVYHTRVA